MEVEHLSIREKHTSVGRRDAPGIGVRVRSGEGGMRFVKVFILVIVLLGTAFPGLAQGRAISVIVNGQPVRLEASGPIWRVCLAGIGCVLRSGLIKETEGNCA